MKTEFIKNEIDKIYSNLHGGFFIEIYDHIDGDFSPLKHLENKYWNGVCISNKKNYNLQRNCFIEPFEFNLNDINQLNVYGDNKLFEKIRKHDRSNLIHVTYINCENSIEISNAFLKGCYEKAMEKEPTAGHWATQVLFLIVNTQGKNAENLINLCEKYFLQAYKAENNILIFKHEAISLI